MKQKMVVLNDDIKDVLNRISLNGVANNTAIEQLDEIFIIKQ